MRLLAFPCSWSASLKSSAPSHRLNYKVQKQVKPVCGGNEWRLTISVVHDNAELALLRFIDFFEPNDVRMGEGFEDLCLAERARPVLFAHFLDIDLLHHSVRLTRTEKVIRIVKVCCFQLVFQDC